MKRVCFVTLSRSDYASLKPVIQAALEESELDVRVVVGGSHLLARFGVSLHQIEKDGVRIDHTVSFLEESDDSDLHIARALGRAYPCFVEYFHDTQPDLVFILGDRWELLAVSTAASLLRIPIVHHSGGDLTQGSFDNQTRYLLTTQSHLHLVAIKEHRKRLIAMGEEEWRVVCTGEPSLVSIQNHGCQNIRAELNLRPGVEFVLATFHPTTFDAKEFKDQIDFLVNCLELIQEEIILTAPNPDPGSKIFLDALLNFSKKKNNVHFFENLGNLYYAAMEEAIFMIGNSSSGILEAPTFGLPVINLGNRQQGRVRAENVVDVPLTHEAVFDAVTKVKSKSFRDSLRGIINPYVHEKTIAFIVASLKQAPTRSVLLEKKLIDPLAQT